MLLTTIGHKRNICYAEPYDLKQSQLCTKLKIPLNCHVHSRNKKKQKKKITFSSLYYQMSINMQYKSGYVKLFWKSLYE